MRRSQLWTKQSSPRTAPSLFWSPTTTSPTSSPSRSPTCSSTKSGRRGVARSLQHAASFPVYSSGRQSDWSWAPPGSGHHRRPLPALPSQPQARQRFSLQADLGQHRQTFVKREVTRRQTFHYCPSTSYKEDREDREDHIYEEIEDEDDSEDDGDDHSFLSLISSERRRNLRLYGLTDWDYGNQRS